VCNLLGNFRLEISYFIFLLIAFATANEITREGRNTRELSDYRLKPKEREREEKVGGVAISTTFYGRGGT
jgi:hypothetical protein